MWHGGFLDWIILGSGYLLALGLFYWLGGVGRAGEVFKRWGSSTSIRPRLKS